MFIADDIIEMSVVDGVGGVGELCKMHMCLARCLVGVKGLACTLPILYLRYTQCLILLHRIDICFLTYICL